MAFVLSYAVESWAFTWHDSFIDLIPLVYLYKEKKKLTTKPPQTNNTVISHPFTSSPNTSENPDGFNSLFKPSGSRRFHTYHLQNLWHLLLANSSCRPRVSPKTVMLCSCHGKITCDKDKGWAWADQRFHTPLIAAVHTSSSFSWCLYREYRGCTKFSFLLTFPPVWNNFIKHTFTQSPYVVMPAVYCSKT